MHEIVCVGDVHEGLNFDFRIDPETGISERALDLHGNFAKAARWAIDHQAALFCILGDLFDRAHVAPVFREMVRKDVIEPLGAAGIEVWILAGNHDEPRRTARSTSLDDYRGYAHVKVFRSPKVEIREIEGRQIGFILIPYMHPEQVVEQVRETLGKEVPRELAYEAARQTWKEWIHNRATDVFGHIHMHQTVDRKIVYAGAPERIDWGERLDPKGFLAVRPDGSWSFVELPARPMDKVEAVVGMGDDVTEKVLEALPPEVAGHLVRIEITLPDELRNRLDEKRLADRLRDAFHYEVKFVSSSRPRVVTEEFTLDPGRLLSDYVDKVLADHPKREAIKVEARRVLKEALA